MLVLVSKSSRSLWRLSIISYAVIVPYSWYRCSIICNGVIAAYPTLGSFRSSRYYSSSNASKICFLSASRTSLMSFQFSKSFFHWERMLSWVTRLVPAGICGRWPGLGGSIHTCWVNRMYSALGMINASRLWFPPASMVVTLLAFCLRMWWRSDTSVYVGVQMHFGML